MSSILDYFRGTPRPGQIKALLELEATWNDYDTFVLIAPTAAGKTKIAGTLALWLASKGQTSAYLPPTNLLVDQALEEFPDFASLHRRSSYRCETFKQSCAATKSKCKKICKGCPFTAAKNAATDSAVVVANPYTFISNRLSKNTLIIDEAHNIINMVQDRWAKRIWPKAHKMPFVETVSDVVAWLDTQTKPELRALRNDLLSEEPIYLIRRDREALRGVEQPVLKLLPINVRDRPPWLWAGRKTRKLVLMSATINSQDIYELGLDRKRVCYIEVESPIPPANRPLVYAPVGNLSYATQDAAMPRVVAKLKELLAKHPERGVIHTTYGFSRKLAQHLDDPRLIWHDKNDKGDQYQHYLDTPGAVLVACGLSEGIDLKGDLGRWQAIIQLPWASLGDAAVAHKAKVNRAWYVWSAVKTLLQAYGRVCRSPTDYGATYVLDSRFRRFFEDNGGMFPEFVKQAVVGLDLSF